MSSCILCGNGNFVKVETEIVCSKCGVISHYDTAETTPVGSKSRMPVHEEQKIGSKNIIVDGITLPHINKKRTEQIISSRDSHLDSFSKICSTLGLPKYVTVNAFVLFQKLKPAKLGSGKTAVFCIHQACMDAGITYDEGRLIAVTRTQLGLKRQIFLTKAIYQVKRVALEQKLIVPSSDDSHEKYFLRKMIRPNQMREAVKISGMFGGKTTDQKMRRVGRYLDAYN